MNRLLSLMMVAVMLFGCLLTGCNVNPSTSTLPGTVDPNTSFPTGPDIALPALEDPADYGLDLSVVDGWAVNFSGSVSGVLVGDGYYYEDEGFLRYLDLNSGVSVFLCSKVTCTHKDETCEATVPFDASLFYWNDGLYYFEQSAEGLQLLVRRDSIGMEKSVVATLGTKILGKDQGLSVAEWILAEGWLYYVLSITDIVRDENGVSMTDGAQVLCRMDLSKGKEEVLTIYDGGILQLLTARSDAAIVLNCRMPELIIGSDGSVSYPDGYEEMLQNAPADLMRWDASTGKFTMLLEATYSVLSSVKFYGGRAVFVTTEGKRYSYDVKTGETKALASIKGTIINEQYMVYNDRSDGLTQLIKNIETGELFPIGLPTGSVYHVYNRSDDWLILKANGLYYIPMSAIADGIQIEDATKFPS